MFALQADKARAFQEKLNSSRFESGFLPIEVFVIASRDLGSEIDDPQLEFLTLPLHDLAKTINEFLPTVGYKPIGNWRDSQWYEMNREQARRLLTRFLKKGQAYEFPIRPLQNAVALAEMFLELFGADARYLTPTNIFPALDEMGDPPVRATGEGLGNRLSEQYTFECGVLAVSPRAIGLVWTFDED